MDKYLIEHGIFCEEEIEGSEMSVFDDCSNTLLTFAFGTKYAYTCKDSLKQKLIAMVNL